MIEHLKRLGIGLAALATSTAVILTCIMPLVYLLIEYPNVFGALAVTAVLLLAAYGVGMSIREG